MLFHIDNLIAVQSAFGCKVISYTVNDSDLPEHKKLDIVVELMNYSHRFNLSIEFLKDLPKKELDIMINKACQMYIHTKLGKGLKNENS